MNMTAKSQQKTKADKRAAALRDNLRKRKEKLKSQNQNTSKSRNDDAKS
jgi:hypothetical protein